MDGWMLMLTLDVRCIAQFVSPHAAFIIAVTVILRWPRFNQHCYFVPLFIYFFTR